MKHDLKKRYHKKDFGYIRSGFLLTIGSVLILFISKTELKDKAAAIFGIFCGVVIFSIGFHGLISGPAQKFFKQQAELAEIEKSYVKGKMLSFGNNGINVGSSYTVIYTQNNVFAIDNNKIQDMTRKMVRVKQYEDNLAMARQRQADATALQREQIAAVREVGVAYGKNQPKTIYKIVKTW